MKFTGERFIPEHNISTELSVEHMHRYYAVSPLLENKTVLDIACGEGYGAAIMSKVASHVHGIDIDTESITHAKKTYPADIYPNITFSEGAAESIPVPSASFDIVVSFETVEHLTATDQKKFFAEIKRVLKKEGVLIISTPDKAHYSEKYNHHNPFHLHELTGTEFEAEIKNYFSFYHIYEQGFQIVSLITPSNFTGLNSLRNITLDERNSQEKRKYLIAMASMIPIDSTALASVVLKTDKDFSQQIDRILELQNEVEGLGKWGQSLDKQRIENESLIRFLQNENGENKNIELKEIRQGISEIKGSLLKEKEEYKLLANTYKNELRVVELNNEEQQKTISELYRENEMLLSIKNEIEDLQETNKNYLNKIQDLSVKIEENEYTIQKSKQEIEIQKERGFQKESIEKQLSQLRSELEEKRLAVSDLQFNYSLTRQQLSEVNNKLITIEHSDAWKWVEKYYYLKGKILNEKYWHSKVLRRTVNFLRGRKELSRIPSLKESNWEIPSNYTSVDTLTLPFYEHPEVSIIIPAHNAWEMTFTCLKSILENSSDVSYEIILADDASEDATVRASEYAKNIIHIRTDENVGFLNNCNKASLHAKGKYLVFLNNDTQVKTAWLSSMLMLIEKDSSIGMVGSKLIYPDGTLQEAGGIIWQDASGWNYGNRKNPDAPEFNYVKEVDYVSGASMLIRSDVWKNLGGFDQRYVPAYSEDSDFAFSIRKAGLKVVYQPLSEVIHYEGYSHGSDQKSSTISSVKEYQKINNEKFYSKWKKELEENHFPNADHAFLARDRSRGKKILLMVDHYVPQYDKDAGSKTTFQYLELFVSLGIHVKFLGENFYRHEPYTTLLQQMGIEVLYGPWFKENWQEWFLANNQYFDYIYLNRPHISINFIDFFKKHSKAKILYYGHDLHFLREEKRYEIEKDKIILAQAKRWKEIESYLFEQSDVILTPSVEESRIISAMNSKYNVQLIRPYIYQGLSHPITDFTERKDMLFVGGFNHQPNTDGIYWFINEILPVIVKELPKIKLIIAGSNPPDLLLNIHSPNIEVKGFVTESELNILYAKCRLVVVPLRYGAGVKGKTVEAMKNGLPIVSTSIGLEGLPGNYNFIPKADDTQHFANAVITLYSNVSELQKISEKSTAYINENFSKDAAKQLVKEFIITS